jgi:hypothetical protein
MIVRQIVDTWTPSIELALLINAAGAADWRHDDGAWSKTARVFGTRTVGG